MAYFPEIIPALQVSLLIIKSARSAGARMAAARSAGFSQIKKIPYQAPPQLGPRKCTFKKTLFWDTNINVRILIFFGKINELPGATF